MGIAFLHERNWIENIEFLDHLPFLATDPPTMRLWATFDNPHPSSGVSKRPYISVADEDTFCPPNYENKTK